MAFFQIFEVRVCDKGPKINLVFIDDNSLRNFQNFLQKGAEWQTFRGNQKVMKIFINWIIPKILMIFLKKPSIYTEYTYCVLISGPSHAEIRPKKKKKTSYNHLVLNTRLFFAPDITKLKVLLLRVPEWASTALLSCTRLKGKIHGCMSHFDSPHMH